MKHAKPIQLLLCAALLLPLTVSCQNPDVSDAVSDLADTASITESVPTTEAVPVIPDLPEKDFGGETFTILTNDRADDYHSVEFEAVEMDGTLINDAVFQRNSAVESKYNIDIVAQAMGNEAQVLRVITLPSADFGTGICMYDL